MIRGGNTGAMDTFLTIQQEVKSQDPLTNEQIVTWTDLGTCWAEKIVNPKSMEGFEGDQQVAKKNYFFRIRYREDLTEQMRVVRGTEINYIKGIQELDRKKFLIVTTEKRDNDGQ